MKTIIGLGNPGKEYNETRHNVGRDTATLIAKHFSFDKLEESKKYFGLFAKGSIGDEKAQILLPETFMNKSGKAAVALAPKPKDLVVIHDDTDLEIGTVKISFAKNSAGHKGVESVMRALKTKEFWRIRIGVQPRKKKRVDAMKLVLQKFSPAEKLLLKKIERRVLDLIADTPEVTTIRI